MKKFIALVTGLVTTSICFAEIELKTFDNETEFYTYLLEESIEMYTPKTAINLEWKSLIYENQLSINVGYKDTKIKICAPLGIFDKQYGGSLFTIEYKF